MYDPIFYPDRTPAEAARLRREGKRFFEAAVRRQSLTDIFWPDLDAEEALALRQEGKRFFEAAVRRKSARS